MRVQWHNVVEHRLCKLSVFPRTKSFGQGFENTPVFHMGRIRSRHRSHEHRTLLTRGGRLGLLAGTRAGPLYLAPLAWSLGTSTAGATVWKAFSLEQGRPGSSTVGLRPPSWNGAHSAASGTLNENKTHVMHSVGGWASHFPLPRSSGFVGSSVTNCY